MNADLKNALTHTHKVIASVDSQVKAETCIAQAQDYWIQRHLGHEWTIVTIDVSLITIVTQAVSAKLVTKKELGVLQEYSLFGFTPSNSLWIYSSDKYTEAWVHSLVLSRATDPSNRILNVQRDDPGELLDLGSFDFSKLS